MVFNKSEAIVYMNHLGKLGSPFFFMVDFEMEAIRIFDLATQTPENISFQSPAYQFGTKTDVVAKILEFTSYPVSVAAYSELFNKVVAEINRGNSFLVNLTFPRPSIAISHFWSFSTVQGLSISYG